MRRAIVFAGIIILAVSSCGTDGVPPCAEEKPSAAILHEFPDSIKVGNTVTVDVAYILESNCGKFDRFDINTVNNSFNVQLITSYEGCNCDLKFSEQHITFVVDLDFPGVYEYKFWQTEGDYDIRTVTVVQ